MKHKIDNYKDFYQFYLNEHRNSTCRILHFTGTALVFALLFYSLFSERYCLLWFLPVVGYAFAWIGHAFFEKNKPATFTYPLWSLISDFKLFFELLTGKQKFKGG
ncbi:Mpo1-like protein [Elizabethkingia meningoseptica]|uniref:Mpo1-like protein n=1 Tax=Elizabethkingia meningoseptica TaxID=238 RepID=UPI0038912C3D